MPVTGMGADPSNPSSERTRREHEARAVVMKLGQSGESMAAEKIANKAPGLYKKKDLIAHIKKLQERVADIQNVVGSVLPAVQGDAGSAVPPPSNLTRNFRATTNGRKLSDLRVGIVGLDGIGAMCAEMLARSGIGGLLVMDDGSVEERHLSSLYFQNEQKGIPRADAVKLCVNDFAPQTQVETVDEDRLKEVLEGKDASGKLDMVIDCSQAASQKKSIAEMCRNAGTTRLECGLSEEAGCAWYMFYVDGVSGDSAFEVRLLS